MLDFKYSKSFTLYLLLTLQLICSSLLYGQSSINYTIKVTDPVGITLFVKPTSIAGSKVIEKRRETIVSLASTVNSIEVNQVSFAHQEYSVERVELDKENRIVNIVVTPFFQEWDGRLLTDDKALPIPNAIVRLPEYPSVLQATTNAKGDFKLKVPSVIQLTPLTKITVNDIEQPRSAVKLLQSSRLIIIRVPDQQALSTIIGYKEKQIQVLTRDDTPVANTRILLEEEPYFTGSTGITVARVPVSGELAIEVLNHEIYEVINDEENSFITVLVEVAKEQAPEVSENEVTQTPTDPIIKEMDMEIGKVVKELEFQKELITEQNKKLRSQIERISTRLSTETDLNPEQRLSLQQLLYSFQRRLYENERAFEEAQIENQLVIARMQQILDGKDSTNTSLREENLAEKRKNAQLARQNEDFRNLLLFATIGVVLLSVLAIIFYLVAKRDRKQKAKISEQAENLRTLNHRITKQNQAITDSLRYAQTIQMAILPDIEKIKKRFKDFFIIYSPKDIVSGDFYWFAENGDKKFIATVDCTGHGVPGAFMSMIGSTLLTRIVEQMNVEDTNLILEVLNEEIIHSLRQKDKVNDDGMDVCLCAIEQQGEENKTKITFTGAKRPLLYMKKGDKTLHMQRGDVKSIGGLRNKEKKFTKAELFLNKGDTLFLTSDGLVDQHNSKKIKFGTRRLISFLENNHSLSMPELGQKLEQELKEHQAEVSQRDDITFLGIRL